MDHTDCQMFFVAGKALLEKSGLVRFSSPCFVACGSRARFNEYWEEEFHPEFGRYMAWVLFSVGAENLAKAACVCNRVVKAKHKPRLEDYVKKHFKGLCGGDDESTLIEGYESLTSVRNRDAHSYRKNKRDSDFPLVGEEFVPAFNILVRSMRSVDHQLQV